MGFIKKQFLDIIQWLDDTNNTILYMYPMEDQEIQNGAQLTVRPGQVAVFVDKGEIADVFGPGMHQLTTENLPVLSDLRSWAYGFKSPFKADVLFINMKEFLNNKWGTANPIWIPDSQFGQVQVRAHGSYSFKIENPVKLINNIAGSKTIYRIEDMTMQLRSIIVNQFSDAVGSLHLTVVQLASNYNEIAEALKETLAKPFGDLGLSVTQFTINNIGLPEEIEKSLQELTHMNIVTSVQNEKMSKLQMLKQMEIMEKATENPGMNSMMQNGMGVGMGIQAANAMMNSMNQMQMQQQAVQQPIQQPAQMSADMVPCPKCHAMIRKDAKFCSQCGVKIEIPASQTEKPKANPKFCPQCGTPTQSGVRFCSQCGTPVE